MRRQGGGGGGGGYTADSGGEGGRVAIRDLVPHQPNTVIHVSVYIRTCTYTGPF